MKKEDARSLPAAAKEEKRKQAVRLRQRGQTYADIAESVGVHERTVIRWNRTYEEEGTKGLKAKALGRPTGAGRGLSVEQEKRIQQLIADKTPDQLKMPYAARPPRFFEAPCRQAISERGLTPASRTL